MRPTHRPTPYQADQRVQQETLVQLSEAGG